MRALVYIFFFISGTCGLIYEVLWCRQLGLVFGNTVQSLSAVLTAFMGGLAIGSYAAGRLCHRLQRPLLAYGVLELGIGLYCAALPWIFSDQGPLLPLYRMLYGETGGNGLATVRFAISFGLLLFPTLLMGASLPVLSHFLIRSNRNFGPTVGMLYSVNTAGAVLGSMAAGFILLPEFGKIATNTFAVACNCLLGIMAIILGWKTHGAALFPGNEPEPVLSDVENNKVKDNEIRPSVLKITVLTFGVTGFAAMATQIGWTRAISLATGSSTYAFSLIVSVFILGLSLGGFWAAKAVACVMDPVAMLAKVLLLVGLLSMAIAALLGFGPLFFFFLLAWGSQSNWGILLAAEALGIALLIIAPTVLMGAILPLTMRIASRNSVNAGRTVGSIYAINTFGAILGSLLGGLVLLPIFQIQRTLEIMALLYVVPGLLLFMNCTGWKVKKTRWVASTTSALLLLSVFISPRWDPMLMSSGIYLLRDRARLNAAREFRIMDALPNPGQGRELLYYKEGAAATVAVIRIGNELSMSVGGKPDATSHGDMPTQISLTLVPEILHAQGPEEVLVIGLGSGVSAGCALAPDTIKRVDVVEMSPEIVEASEFFQPFNTLTYIGKRMVTPKVELLINDGRNHLLLSSRKYDVIASEPSNPWMAGVGNLFTKEAFALARSRLKPGGIMCQWIHGYALDVADFYSIIRTFGEVFPQFQLWCVNRGDFLLVGSDSELRIPIAQLQARLSQLPIRRWLERVHFDTEHEFLACFLSNGNVLRDVSTNSKLHTDDNMLLEFSAPRALYSRSIIRSTQFLALPEYLVNLDGQPASERGEFIRAMDLAANAREHIRYSFEGVGPKEEHLKAAWLMAPHQFWVREFLNIESGGRDARSDQIFREAQQQWGQGHTSAALMAFQQSAALDPFNPLMKVALSEALIKTADLLKIASPATALQLLRYARRTSWEICVLHPELAQGSELLCRCFIDLRMSDPMHAEFYHGEAKKAFQKALEIHKGDLSKIAPGLAEEFRGL